MNRLDHCFGLLLLLDFDYIVGHGLISQLFHPFFFLLVFAFVELGLDLLEQLSLLLHLQFNLPFLFDEQLSLPSTLGFLV